MLKSYKELLSKKSDIYLHLPILKEYADKCKHVTELGVRDVVASYAFLEADLDVYRGYDIVYHPNMSDATKYALNKKIDCKFIINNTLKVELENTDFIFFDTLHTNNQLKIELKLHANKANKYLGFHDLVSFGLKDEGIPENKPNFIGWTSVEQVQGLTPVIFEFLRDNKQWKIDYYTPLNNGLLILSKC